MYNIRFLLVSTILLLSLVAVACGGDDDASTVSLSSVTATSQTAADATKAADRAATATRTAPATKTVDETETPTVDEPTPTPETPTPEPPTEEPEPPTEEPEPPTETPVPSTPAPAYPLAAQVALQSYNAFEPGYVEIAAGGSVTFVWNGGFHNVVSAGAPALPSEHPDVMDSGSFTIVFETPGVYSYQCIVHPGMSGSVAVY